MAYYSTMPTVMMGASFYIIVYYLYWGYAVAGADSSYAAFYKMWYTAPILYWQITGWLTLILNSMTSSAYGNRLSGPDSAFKGASATALFFPIVTLGGVGLAYSGYSASCSSFTTPSCSSQTGAISGAGTDLVTVNAGVLGFLAIV